MEEFKEFLIKLFAQMSLGNPTVMVRCANNEQHLADVIGYSEEYMTIKVRFHSDELRKPARREVKVPTLGLEEETMIEDYMAPVKEENIFWTYIEIK